MRLVLACLAALVSQIRVADVAKLLFFVFTFKDGFHEHVKVYTALSEPRITSVQDSLLIQGTWQEKAAFSACLSFCNRLSTVTVHYCTDLCFCSTVEDGEDVLIQQGASRPRSIIGDIQVCPSGQHSPAAGFAAPFLSAGA